MYGLSNCCEVNTVFISNQWQKTIQSGRFLVIEKVLIYEGLRAGVKTKTDCIHLPCDQGILAESLGAESSDRVFTLMEGMVETSKNGGDSGSCEELLAGDEEGERSVASAEDQIRKEMTVYEVRDSN